MKRRILLIAFSLTILLSLHHPQAYAAPACSGPLCLVAAPLATSCTPKGGFLGLPAWYSYLPGKQNPKGGCDPQLGCDDADINHACDGQSGIDISKIWLIAFAVLEILLRLGGLIAFAMIVFAGFKYITSQGNPDATKAARGTIINAFIGMVITIIAAVAVSFGVKLLQR